PEPAEAEDEEDARARGIRAVDDDYGQVRGTGTDGTFSRSGEVPTPRRRVVFDDPDDLDVPDFLK
ncbi:cell division protein FtsZ, partial [Streptomonospora algeriensis]